MERFTRLGQFFFISLFFSTAFSNSPDLAYWKGHSDGEHDGSRAGAERGREDGKYNGYHEAYRMYFDRCTREEGQRQYDLGYHSGYQSGYHEGQTLGEQRGRSDGRNAGEQEGSQAGESKADRDAYDKATPLGTEQGIKDADSSDARERGRQAGLQAGDHEALQEAIQKDFPRGREEYRKDRFLEPVKYHDQFSQKSIELFEVITAKGNKADELFSTDRDRRYYRPRPHPQYNLIERQAYHNGYERGYLTGYDTQYTPAYRSGYSEGSTRGALDGCAAGRNQDFRSYYNRGLNDGRRKGYSDGYQATYTVAYEKGRKETFEPAFQNAYQINYPKAYERHFEKARERAFEQHSKHLYEEAFKRARDEKFEQLYPIYAREQFQKGQQKEAEDFKLRPTRLLEAQITETNDNGLFEPGEDLHVQFKIRNFDESEIQGKDIRITLTAYDSSNAVISNSEATLARNIREKSIANVTEAFEFRVNESTVKSAVSFAFKIFLRGRLVGEQELKIEPRFILDLQAVLPVLKEGLPVPFKTDLTNQASQASGVGVRLKLALRTQEIEVEKPELTIGAINPGKTASHDFILIARTPEIRVLLPFAMSAYSDSNRRIGLLDQSLEVPVKNDYKIYAIAGLSGLKTTGVRRVHYKIQNISSRLISRGLQITARFIGDVQNQMVVIGNNPQYLPPLDPGETDEFLFPVLVKSDNGGGVLEFEVLEDGVAVVTHREKF